MKDFNQPQQDFVNSMGRAFRTAQDIDRGTIILVGLGIFITLIITIYILNQRWHWVRGKWIFLQKYFAGDAVSTSRKSKQFEVVVEIPYGPDRTLRAMTEDLSPTGMFIRLNPPLKKGEIIHFLLVLSPDQKINARAEIKWAQNRWTEHHPSGNGCKFLNLEPEDQKKIRLSLEGK